MLDIKAVPLYMYLNNEGDTEMTQQMKNAIAAMQRKAPAGALVWRNANGTFSHHRDANGEFATEDAARTDLRFCNEWAA